MRFLCLFAICVLGAWAQDGGFEYYQGSINEKYGIQMNLTRNATEMMGTYFYMTKQTGIDLSGTIAEDGTFTMTETVDGKDTGTFKGRIQEGGRKLEGTWTAGAGGKLLPFVVRRFAVQQVEERETKVKGQTVTVGAGHPVFGWGGGAKEEALNRMVKDWLDRRINGFLKEAEEMVVPDFQGEFSIDIGAEVPHFASGGAGSILFFTYTYAGGAHGMTTYDCLNVDLSGETPKSLGLTDLLVSPESGLAKLAELCLADLKKQEASWVVDGTLTSLGKEELAVFTISPRGLTFYFEPYAVGSYAEGPYEVTLGFDAVSDVLKVDLLKNSGVLPAK